MLARFILFFVILLVGGESIARADTVRVIGALFDKSGKLANGYVVKLVLGVGKIEIRSDTTENGLFEMTNDSVDPGSLGEWYLLCVPQGEIYEKKITFSRKGNTNNWSAKINIRLTSMRQPRYTRSVAQAVISEYTTAQSLLAQAGEITESEANELISREVAQILRRTELGEKPDESLHQIYDDILRSSDKSLLPTPVLNKDYFLALRENPNYRDYDPEIDPAVLPQPSIESPPNYRQQLPDTIAWIDIPTYRTVQPSYLTSPRRTYSFGFRSDLFVSGFDRTSSLVPVQRSYVYSSLEGNYEGLYRNDPNLLKSPYFLFHPREASLVPPLNPLKSYAAPSFFSRSTNSGCVYQNCAITGDGKPIILRFNGTWFYTPNPPLMPTFTFTNPAQTFRFPTRITF